MNRDPSNGFMTTATAPLSLANCIMPMAVSMSVSGSTLAHRSRPPASFHTSAIQRFQLVVSAMSTSGRSVIPRIHNVLCSTWISMPNESMCASRRPTSSTSRAPAAVIRSRPVRSDSVRSCCSLSVASLSPHILPSMTHWRRAESSSGPNSLGRYFSSDGSM